jgi:hypothetical protein
MTTLEKLEWLIANDYTVSSSAMSVKALPAHHNKTVGVYAIFDTVGDPTEAFKLVGDNLEALVDDAYAALNHGG